MRFMWMIIDQFLENPSDVRDKILRSGFRDVTSPVDGVVYPHICEPIDDNVREEVELKLMAILGSNVKINFLFARNTLRGTPVPHEAHSDVNMGTHALLVYLSHPFHGGTSVLEHKGTALIEMDAGWSQETEWMQSEANVPGAWNVHSLVPGKWNRAMLYRASVLHRAEPVGGWGKDFESGRLVLTCFFDVISET